MNGEYVRHSPPRSSQSQRPVGATVSTAWRPTTTRARLEREPVLGRALWRKWRRSSKSVSPALGEIPEMVEFFFVDDLRCDQAAFAKVIINDPTVSDPGRSHRSLRASWTWGVGLHEAVQQLGDAHGLALRKRRRPIRCRRHGSLVGPPLFESLEYLDERGRLQHCATRSQRSG